MAEFDTRFDVGRRAFLGTGLGAGAAALGAQAARAAGGSDAEGAFEYEVSLTDGEWRERLTPDEHVVLRKGITELPRSSDLWNETAEGTYCCRGCDLPTYDSVWKRELDIGYAFFRQSRENALLMGIDGEPPESMMNAAQEEESPFGALIEVHCRRCGSHLGHILTVGGETLHCINGIALNFAPSTA